MEQMAIGLQASDYGPSDDDAVDDGLEHGCVGFEQYQAMQHIMGELTAGCVNGLDTYSETQVQEGQLQFPEGGSRKRCQIEAAAHSGRAHHNEWRGPLHLS